MTILSFRNLSNRPSAKSFRMCGSVSARQPQAKSIQCQRANIIQISRVHFPILVSCISGLCINWHVKLLSHFLQKPIVLHIIICSVLSIILDQGSEHTQFCNAVLKHDGSHLDPRLARLRILLDDLTRSELPHVIPN